MASAALLMDMTTRLPSDVLRLGTETTASTTKHGQNRATRVAFWFGACGSVATVGFGFTTPRYAKSHDYIDVPCDEVYNLPFLVVKISAAIYLVLVSSYGQIRAMEWLTVYLSHSPWWPNSIVRPTSIFSTASEIILNKLLFLINPWKWFNFWEKVIPIIRSAWMDIECSLLCLTFALVIVVRQKAQGLFGTNYDDNSAGYGQILAAGFCVQTVVDSIVALTSKYSSSYRDLK